MSEAIENFTFAPVAIPDFIELYKIPGANIGVIIFPKNAGPTGLDDVIAPRSVLENLQFGYKMEPDTYRKL